MSVRRLVLIVVAAAIALAGALAASWRLGAGRVRAEAETWADARRAEGWSVTWDGLAVDGFPWTLRLTVAEPRLTRPDGLSWAAPALRLWTRLPWPATTHAETAGRQQFGGPGWSETVEVERFAASWRHQHWDAHVHHVVWRGGAIADLAGTIARVPPDHIEAVPTDPQQPASWRFAVSARDVALAQSPLKGLDSRVAVAELSGQVRGTLPDLPPAAAIARWAKEGGTIEVDRLALDWTPMALEADGTAALDPAGQPLVALSARISGFSPLMDRLVAGGDVPAATATTVKAMLTLLAKPDTRGQPAVSAPVTVQDGALFLGPARLVRHPPIPWADLLGR